MDRRTLLTALGTLAAVGSLPAFGDQPKESHVGHHGAGHHGAAHADLVKAAATCVGKGEVCLDHCLILLGEGDKTVAACSRSVNEMLAVCGALHKLAVQDAASLPKFAGLAAGVCKACEDECRKHEKHAACRDCADACAQCGKACRKIAA